MEALYLENLEELVNDENKVVSYKLLSSVLNVHVNQAKQMLYAFVQDQRNKKDNDSLYVTYFVAGLTKPVNGVQVHKCVIVPEESLSSCKNSLAVVTSSHIYSIQKSKVKDANILYSADYEAAKQNICDTHKFSAIRHTGMKIKSEADRKRAPPPPSLKSEDNSSSTNKTNGAADTKPRNLEGSKPAQKKGGIASMFAQQAEKKPLEITAKSEEKKEEKKAQNDPKAAKKGVMNFFANHTGKKSEPKQAENTVERVKTEKVKEVPQQQQKDKGRGKKTGRGDEKETDERKRKRRRIVQEASDSSSEEEIDYESPIPSPVREPSPPPPEKEPSPSPESPIQKEVSESRSGANGKAETSERHRKRRRKLVPKTFMDEDGYMVTEKVWESESTDASDAESAPPTKKVAPPPQKTSPTKKTASPKKKSPPSSGNRKQMALTSFFTKK